jgi:outer membrane protein assembly factor BamA
MQKEKMIMSNKTLKSAGAGKKRKYSVVREFKRRFIFIFCLLMIQPFQIIANATEAFSNQSGNDSLNSKSASLLPIAMYDSDIGFGVGVKTVAKNFCGNKESFDLMLFTSSKGEQTYSLAFSMPDKGLRLKTKYPAALDVKIEFNKLIRSNFFGFGNYSQNNDYQFPKESSTLQFAFGRAFSEKIVAEAGMRLVHYSVYGYRVDWHTIMKHTPGAYENDVIAVPLVIRYDSRNSVINPVHGLRVEISFEQAVKIAGADWNFRKYRLESSIYKQLIRKNHVIALRCWLQQVDGQAPYQELSKIGDSWTTRGYKADRFIDKAMGLVSAEYRFPIYKKLGGVLFVDSGRVWKSLDKFNFDGWHFNWGGGLRYYMANFVTRLDLGHSHEGTRIFLNFGQVF